MTQKAQSPKPKSEPQRTLHLAIVKQMITLSTSGFGVVAALAWNNVIQEVVSVYIKPYIPNAGLFSLLIYAVLVTVIAVTITINLSKLATLLEKTKEEPTNKPK